MRKVWLIGALLASLALLLWWTMERYQYVVHLAPQARDRAASAVLLDQHGISSRRLHSQAQLFPLPDTDSVLIFREPRGRMEQSQLDQLTRWISSGGTLIMEVVLHSFSADVYGEDSDGVVRALGPGPAGDGQTADQLRDADPLAYAFGITGWHTMDDPLLVRAPVSPEPFRVDGDWTTTAFERFCLAADDEAQDYCNELMCGDINQVLAYSQGQMDQTHFTLDLDPHGQLLHRGVFELSKLKGDSWPALPNSKTNISATLGNDQFNQLLKLDLGDGHLIAMTDTEIWSNQRLHHLNHAALLLALTEGAREVVWIEHVQMPPLLDWLWERAWPLMVSAMILVALLVWRSLPRRGPVLSPSADQPLDFIEHLRASARFLWRHNRGDAVLLPLRTELKRRIDQQGSKRDNRSRAKLASALSGMDELSIRDALELEPQDSAGLIETVNTLQALRSKL